ncbi:MAG: hypothetical protein HND47_12685 [Chloroflexi bacterium]|nr:hypothetical protein [Chloroflexota bacterium]
MPTRKRGRCSGRQLKYPCASRAIPAALYALAGIAGLYEKMGATAQAYELAVFCARHPSSSRQTMDSAEKLLVELESQLTPEEMEASRLLAQSMTLDGLARELENEW